MTYITRTKSLADAVIEAHASGEVWATLIPEGASAKQRAETLDSIGRVVDYLRREGYSPEVIVRRVPGRAEVHAIGIRDVAGS